ncbi:helix-hairpin-helix domain-containing protein [Aeromonas caviae]
MRFCNAHLGLSVSTSFLVSDYYQQETISKVSEDPYRLLAFGVDFNECDRISVALGKVRTSIPRTKNENFSHLISMGYQ